MARKTSLLGFRKATEYHSSNNLIREIHSVENKQYRQNSLESWLRDGGDVFLRWTKRYYTLSSGDLLEWYEPFWEDYYRLLGEPRVEDLYIGKGSQMGYTESIIAFTAFFLSELRLPIGFGFESFNKQQDMVGSRVQLSFSHCKPIQELNESQRRVVKRKDTDTKNAITVGGTKATFFYADKQKASSESNAIRQASSRLSSFTAFGIIADEVELWQPGILDVMRRRMDATILPNKIVRAGSTPGAEGGVVDVMVKSCQYRFEWHVDCPHCGTVQPLSGFGNLLKGKEVAEEGRVIVRYLDKGGRPLDWFHEDPDYRQETAYVGCRKCGGKLEKEVIADGEYVCTVTGKTIEQFFADRRQSSEPVDRVSLQLPKLATTRFSAPNIIKELFTTDNPADVIQQGLGLPFSIGTGKIQFEVLMECVGLAIPEQLKQKGHDMVVMGLDQGKYTNHVMIFGFYFADEPSKELKWRNARKELLWWGTIDTFEELAPLIEQYKVLVIGMDSEPEWGLAAEYCYHHPPKGPTVISLENFSYLGQGKGEIVRGKHGGVISGIQEGGGFDLDYWMNFTSGMSTLGQVYLFDQVNLDKTQYKRTMKNIKSHSPNKVPVYSIDRTFWLDMVRDRIYLRHSHFPPHVTYNPKDKNNLLYQYLTSDRLISERRWVESGPDHFFHADNFAEAAAFVSMFEDGV